MKILIVVDMQHDFVYGSLGTPEAASIVDNVRQKVSEYIAGGNKVFYTKDTHTSEYLHTQEGRNLPVEHCIKGTPGWDFVDGVYQPGAPVIEKTAFGSLRLVDILSDFASDNSVDIDEIELVGLCTDICVLSNAMILKAAFPEVRIKVDGRCCAGVSPESHNRALEAMKVCQIEVG